MKTKLYQFILKEREKTAKVLEQVALMLQNNGVAIIPTETCYVITIDATSEEAAKRVLALGVVPSEGHPVLVSDLRMAQEYLNVNEIAVQIANAFMPGPVTVLVDRAPESKLSPTMFPSAAAFRVSSNVFARALSNELGKPLAIFILPDKPIYNLKEIQDKFTGKVEAIVGAGDLPHTPPTTVVDVRSTPLKLVREGQMPLSEINALVTETSQTISR
ncbi:MAG: Sua5/YciO/YrdC/YwlC family protein [Candidatus Micrarchaeota archaeon]